MFIVYCESRQLKKMGADVNAFTDMLDSLMFSFARAQKDLGVFMPYREHQRQLRCASLPKPAEWNSHLFSLYVCMHAYMYVHVQECMCAISCSCRRKNSPLPSRANTAKAKSRKLPEGEEREREQERWGKNCEGERKLKMNLRDGVQMVVNGLEK